MRKLLRKQLLLDKRLSQPKVSIQGLLLIMRALQDTANQLIDGSTLAQEPTRNYRYETSIKAVEKQMRFVCAHFAKNSPFIDALDHHLTSGGNRTRAQLALTASSALDLPHNDAVVLAASVELLHNASLVQDDLQDGDIERRGRPTVWRRFGRDIAIGLTDLLISSAYAVLADISKTSTLPRLIQQLHLAITHTLQGQANDLALDKTYRLDFEECVAVARAKSGPLFALALELPLIAVKLSEYGSQAHEAACSFGTGYQLSDDIIDLEEDRNNGALANTVLALERSSDTQTAVTETYQLARRHLNTAARLGAELPNGCGYLLIDLATRLDRRLTDACGE